MTEELNKGLSSKRGLNPQPADLLVQRPNHSATLLPSVISVISRSLRLKLTTPNETYFKRSRKHLELPVNVLRSYNLCYYSIV